jgi:hypothetical protein
MASLASNGTSTSSLNYQFTDAKPFATNSYYRLKQVDKDGKSTFSQIVLLKGNTVNGIQFTAIYPNPVVADNLHVLISSSKDDKVTVIVSDMAGKVISQQSAAIVNGDNNIQIGVSNLAKGTYTIRTVTSDNQIQSKVFIKQ